MLFPILTHLPCVQHFASNGFVKEKVSEAVDHLDESVVESLAVKYLEDIKAGRATEEKWTFPHHYKESKLCLNTYTRILAGELEERGDDQRILVNALCPGLFSSDMSMGALAKIDPEIVKQIIAQYGPMFTSAEAATAPVWLALLPKEDPPHGHFFIKRKQLSTF